MYVFVLLSFFFLFLLKLHSQTNLYFYKSVNIFPHNLQEKYFVEKLVQKCKKENDEDRRMDSVMN